MEVRFRRYTPDQDFAISNPQTMLATANERDWKEKWTEQLFDSFITLKKFEEEIEKASGINLAENKGLVLQGYKNKKNRSNLI